jgi:LysR family transcriptional regulator for metE and metH
VLVEYQHRFPKVEARIVADATRRPLPALIKGQLDVAIVSTPVRDKRLDAVPLFSDELVAVVGKQHAWAGRRQVAPEEFKAEHVLLYTMRRSESTLLSEVLAPAGVTPKQISHVELTEAIIELVKAGLGVGFLARWAVAPHVRAGTLATVSVNHPAARRQWTAVVRREQAAQPHLTAFVELLRRNVITRDGPSIAAVQLVAGGRRTTTE